ncbi:hypothetical protein pdul_cds_646 [Pandoravirus dulcis]|uniref:DUF5878 domain-containing protein n=1 Tax=Pandoravirus dulcis TaxID=1349409 RepID=S4VQZ4_9VIRU|nr:hypothetical protein pdul_cds_646 [Pandoravirus dulcis]AGO82788.2 hypothetical protein pdul_cds_646 [Pandoravirus dulcis]
MAYRPRRQSRGRAGRGRRSHRGKAPTMAATATSKPIAPRDRETLWKMHVHGAVSAGAATVCRPADADRRPRDNHAHRVHSNGGNGDDDGTHADAAFVRIALDVLDDCGMLCARVVPGAPATIEMGPRRIDGVWAPIVDRALAAAVACAPASERSDRPPPSSSVIGTDAVYASCCEGWSMPRRDFTSLGPHAQAALRALIIKRAASLSMSAVPAGPFAYRLVRTDPTISDASKDDPGSEDDPIYGGPGIGWALFKAYAIALAVIVPLAMALCMDDG